MAIVFTIKLTLASGNSEYLDQVFNDYSLARKTALDISKQNKFFALMETEPDLWSDGNTKVQVCATDIKETDKIETNNKKRKIKSFGKKSLLINSF